VLLGRKRLTRQYFKEVAKIIPTVEGDPIHLQVSDLHFRNQTPLNSTYFHIVKFLDYGDSAVQSMHLIRVSQSLKSAPMMSTPLCISSFSERRNDTKE
jgi:hypothetical protein